jgi:hypothetical protein
MLTKCRDSNPPLGGVLYAGGSYTKGGSYMPVNTVGGRCLRHNTSLSTSEVGSNWVKRSSIKE